MSVVSVRPSGGWSVVTAGHQHMRWCVLVWVAQKCRKKWKLFLLLHISWMGQRAACLNMLLLCSILQGTVPLSATYFIPAKCSEGFGGGTNKLNSQGMGEVKAEIKQSTSSDWLKSAYLHNPSDSWELFFILQTFSHSNRTSVRGGRFSSWKFHQKQCKKRRVLSCFQLFF